MNNKNIVCDSESDIDVVIEAGKILMESGAEIYRIEDTMNHMAASLKIDNFDSYVVNREIIASGTNNKGIKEAKVTGVPETTVHLSKLEAVNSLSRELEQDKSITSKEIASRLKKIREFPDSPIWLILISYFIGAGCFSYAIGCSVRDSICSAIAGLIMGIVVQIIGRYIKTKVLITIIGSAIVTVTAYLLCLWGIGEHRGLIILGTLMLSVPGAAFTNSVREFSQNNYATGLTLLMSSLLTCLSIGVGIAVMVELLPFSEQINSTFLNNSGSLPEIIAGTAAVGIGTVVFSILFHAPKKYYLNLGLLGALSWLLYLIFNKYFNIEALSVFIPTLFAALSSSFLSIKRKCPMTIFLSTSIFPLLPGLSFFRAVYFLMTGDPNLAWDYMRSCFISAFTIALAIIIVQEIRMHWHRK